MAEDLLSEGILPARGILAGCPFATMMARVYLQPIMQEAARLRSITALDTWVDDIGADFEARYPEQAAFAVYEGYRTLRRLLEGSDLRLSLKKTGFLCTTAEARRELQKLRKDGDPAICDSMKDLGLDCALGRVRRVKVQRARRHKAGQRQKKLKQLKVPGVPAKVRLFRGGVASVLTWGHQAQGMPPTRRQKLRTALAEQCGRQKMGNLEVALSSVGDRYQDPGRTMMFLEPCWQLPVLGLSPGTIQEDMLPICFLVASGAHFDSRVLAANQGTLPDAPQGSCFRGSTFFLELPQQFPPYRPVDSLL